MNKIDQLESKVRDLYQQNLPDREEWAGWLVDNHVFVVADYASELSKKYGANVELARAAAMLHDIADIKMRRADPNHEMESLNIARNLMREVGYGESEIGLVVDDAIRYHSCHGSERPVSIEGKILATADSLAHLKTDFYIFAISMTGSNTRLEEIKNWVLKKIDRDLNYKILFNEIREEVVPDYNLIRELFSR